MHEYCAAQYLSCASSLFIDQCVMVLLTYVSSVSVVVSCWHCARLAPAAWRWRLLLFALTRAFVGGGWCSAAAPPLFPSPSASICFCSFCRYAPVATGAPGFEEGEVVPGEPKLLRLYRAAAAPPLFGRTAAPDRGPATRKGCAEASEHSRPSGRRAGCCRPAVAGQRLAEAQRDCTACGAS